MSVIRRLIGVYDADGTLRGEVTYWIGARLGRAHCSLCEITHGAVRQRPEWTRCRNAMPVPFATFHRDDQPDAVSEVTGGRTPVVAAETDDGVVELLDGVAIEACGGSPDRLAAALTDAAVALDLTWP